MRGFLQIFWSEQTSPYCGTSWVVVTVFTLQWTRYIAWFHITDGIKLRGSQDMVIGNQTQGTLLELPQDTYLHPSQFTCMYCTGGTLVHPWATQYMLSELCRGTIENIYPVASVQSTVRDCLVILNQFWSVLNYFSQLATANCLNSKEDFPTVLHLPKGEIFTTGITYSGKQVGQDLLRTTASRCVVW